MSDDRDARVRERMHRARELIAFMANGNRTHVLTELGYGRGRTPSKTGMRLLAAIAFLVATDKSLVGHHRTAGINILNIVAQELDT